MPAIQGTITERGALVRIQVGVSRARRENLERMRLPVPAPVELLAEVDTGSALTLVPPRVFKDLEVGEVGFIEFLTPSTRNRPHRAPQYSAGLTLEGTGGRLAFPFAQLVASHFRKKDAVQAVLGRDVLAECVLTYDGQRGSFTLAF